TGIDATLEAFHTMERAAGPAVKRNWRFQQALYRAYCDGCVRARLRRESEVAEAARAKLREARSLGALRAAAEADELLAQAPPAAPGRRGGLGARPGVFRHAADRLRVPQSRPRPGPAAGLVESRRVALRRPAATALHRPGPRRRLPGARRLPARTADLEGAAR